MPNRANTRLVAGLAFAWVLLMVATILAYRSRDRQYTHNEGVLKSYSLLGETKLLQNHLMQLETAERGYLVTNDPSFINEVRRAKEGLLPQHAKLVGMVNHNPAQVERLDSARVLIAKKATLADTLIVLSQRAGTELKQKDMVVVWGHPLMQSIQTILTDFSAEEQTLLVERWNQSEDANRATTRFFLFSLGLSVIFGLGAIFLHLRSMRRKAAAEAENVAFNERLQGMFSSSTSGIIMLDAIRDEQQHVIDFTYAAANDIALQLLHYDRDKVMGKRVLDISSMSPQHPIFIAYTQAVEEQKPYHTNYLHTLSDGSRVWLEISVAPMPNGIAINYNDITDRKESEMQLRRQTQVVDNMVENMPIILFRYRKDGTMEQMIGKGMDRLGLPLLPQAGLNIYEAFHWNAPLLKEVFDKSYTYMLAESEPGTDLYWSFETHLFRDTQDADLAIGLALDITPLKQQETALREQKGRAEVASQFKTRFLANMSHEIRTPISAILGFAEVLRHKTLSADPETGEYLGHITTAGDTLLKLIGDILDLTKIEEGKMSLVSETFHLREVLQSTLTPYALRAHEKGLSFDLELNDNLPNYVIGDAGRIVQVLVNLIGNAVKFTTQGGIRIIAETKGTPGPDDAARVCFSVIDSGLGISPDQRARVFESFTQADDSIRRQFGGSGLGLSIVRELVLLMGGEVIIESPAQHGYLVGGSGSRFAFTLSFEQSEAPIHAMPTTAMHRLVFEVPVRVLLVEDMVLNQRLAQIILQDANCKVDIAANGKEALEKAAQKPYDIILMDVQMPVMDGLSATRQLRTVDTVTPIIGLSANVYREEIAGCLAAGMTDFLAKPYQSASLLAMLSRHVVAPFHLRGMPGQSDEPHVAKQRSSEATAGATGLDLTYLEEITDNDAPLMAEMLEAYTNVAEEFLSKMAQGASGNGKALAATAHKLKGAIAMPGLFHLATALEAFEKQALTGSHWNVLQAKGQPLADEIEANLVAVKQWLEKVQTL